MSESEREEIDKHSSVIALLKPQRKKNLQISYKDEASIIRVQSHENFWYKKKRFDLDKLI
jgi:hypothetical protein